MPDLDIIESLPAGPGNNDPIGHNPKLKPKEHYAMRSKKSGFYIRNPQDPVLVEDPGQARLWSGAYLNVCIWDWSIPFEAVTQKDLMASIGKNGKLTAPDPKSKEIQKSQPKRSLAKKMKRKTKKK